MLERKERSIEIQIAIGLVIARRIQSDEAISGDLQKFSRAKAISVE
ncbi:MAG: hypothetical protein GQF41_2788 [Candidatus Rifleibacterium amylolyticum]|jgi:hypothetical protein|nr:MAG: hypothetical protein GQF41_2788 [Candidatus Rifleibacterium amylolyticum]